ncbi:hypothetical protein DV096_19880 [Bradymonadaceae bacterium TMQ3]|uniref:EGF-like domain-containing protein n=1 Tax=Lujinxingia sediminis TaxID=2480984 RepID=A0ABY0CN17_9DELT|nr:hypothetical protein [Lujinxingia sediminis]RDV36311.1 hypothetical protein DV096_19880 [Bradymonadaceae bacterium TMQ3]RVU41052.1 hypothetical protein EA187_19315 [Lujinxingia sediminis]TXC67897.1 hypothetical protein FRC91_19655 [Bradymonadales bacterium TMQ1]
MNIRTSLSTLLIFALLAAACSDDPDAPNPQEPDTDLSDTGPDANEPDTNEPDTDDTPDANDEPDTDDTPDVDDEPDAEEPPTCQEDSCTEEGRTSCEVVDDAITCLCDEGLVEVGDQCLEPFCDAQGLSEAQLLADTSNTNVYSPRAIAGLGATYAVVWSDDLGENSTNTDLYMARFDRDGQQIGDNIALTDSPFFDEIGPHALASDGEMFALARIEFSATQNKESLFLERFDAQGQSLGVSAPLVEDRAIVSPNLVATDQGWLLSWKESLVEGGDYHWTHRLAALSATGELLAGPIDLTTYQADSAPHMIWVEDHAALVWRGYTNAAAENDATFFQRFDALADPIDEAPIRVGDSQSYTPWVMWTGEHYAIVSILNARYFLLNTLDADGEAVLVDEDLTTTSANTYDTHATWTGGAIALSWRDQGALILQEFDASGAPRDEPIAFEQGVSTSVPILANLGDFMALAWMRIDSDPNPMNGQLFMATYCAH